MDFWKSLAGMVQVELTSAEPGTAFYSAAERNIPMFQVEQIGDLTAQFCIYRKDYSKLAALCQKRGETLRLCGYMGAYWSIKKLLYRPLLLAGLTIFLTLMLFLPTRILFVRVEGNSTVPVNKILEAAEESGICFGASRRNVRSEKVKNALLGALPELQWAGINTSGCVATISVWERTEQESMEEECGVSSIVAVRDGVVYSCTVTRGNTLCSVGQAVKAGQTLVSGYTDCGIRIRAERAEGEIYARTNRQIVVKALSKCTARTQIIGTEKKYSLVIGKKRINLWKDSGIWDSSCGRMYKEYYITLPGGFQLPVALVVEAYISYEVRQTEVPEFAAGEALSRFADGYLLEQMVAGSILSRTEVAAEEAGAYCMNGTYICTEMIGRVKREQIGE